MSPVCIVGFGEALVDVLPSGEVVGGAPLNFAVRAAELGSLMGCRAALVSRIGADRRGEEILTTLRNTSLDTGCVQVDATRQTGYVDVVLLEGQPSYTIGEDVAWDEISYDEQVATLAYETNVVCFGTLAQRRPQSRESLRRFLESARAATKILDINLREPFPELEVIENSLRAADILKCNEQELSQLSHWLHLDTTLSPLEIAEALQDIFQLRSVFWTRGAEGCRLQSGRLLIEGEVPRLAASVDADSVGAGDAASAALAVGVGLNWSPQRIVDAANLCGAFAASQRGPTAPMSPDVLARLEKI